MLRRGLLLSAPDEVFRNGFRLSAAFTRQREAGRRPLELAAEARQL